ncbi:MAG: TonB-dependent receptor [Gemmatimonadales bacterium]|nr:TonB-dependent receptor [Gemmatimonadales bacterium]
MKQSGLSSLARLARSVALAAVVTGFGASALAAQGATGKLEGRIRDQGGTPVANARVIIVGTAFSAVANPQGYYFFNSVPAGTINIRVQYVGYKPTELAGIRITSGQTITQDVSLEATAVVVTEIVVIEAKNALVPRDQVTTKQGVDGNFADKLPIDRIGNILALQPGVQASPGGGTLSVRGSRADENSTYVDGVPVTAGNRGTGASSRGVGGLSIGTNAFEDASITTGASSAEYGNAQGGVIAITTRTGGNRFAGNVGYETDEFSGLNQSAGFNRVQASLGGPIMKNLTFFFGGVLEGTRAGQYGFRGHEVPSWTAVSVDTTYAVPRSTSATADTNFVDVYNYAVVRGECDADYVTGSSDPGISSNYGFDCLGGRNAYSPSTTYQLTGKLNYSFGQGSRVVLSYITNRGQNRNATGRASDLIGAALTKNNVLTANWNQQLSKSSSRALALDAYFSYQWDRSIGGFLTPESEADTRDPFNSWLIKDLDFLYDFDNFPVTDQLVNNYRTQAEGTAITVLDRRNSGQYGGQNGFGGPSGNPGAAGGGGSVAGSLNTARETRLIGKANLDWQVDRYNRMKIGGEYTKYDMSNYAVASSTQAFSDLWLAKPVRYNAFVEDRLDLGDVVLVGGLRYDFFDVNASKWRGFPRISSRPGFTADSLAANPDAFLEPYKSHDYISPHIQVAFPVTERTNFRLSYAQQVQTPDFSVVLQGSNTDLSITNTNNNYGSDLDFGKSIIFEFGVRHAFSDDMVLDVTVYNKDNLANPAGRLVPLIDPLGGDRNDIRLTVNQDFGNTRGMDLRLDRRFGNLFNGFLNYSYQDAKNTGTDPYSYINFGSRILSGLSGTNAPPPQAAQPTNISRPHSISGAFALNFPGDFRQGTVVGAVLNRLGANATFRYASGTPYTRCDPLDAASNNVRSGTPCGNTSGGDFNAARLPAYKEFNLRVTKGFQLGSLDLTAYADARNLLNFRNISRVYTQTGDVKNQTVVDLAYTTDSINYRQFAAANNAVNPDGSFNLPTQAGCGTWVSAGNVPSAPSCYYYVKAEQRFGNGDGVYTLAEQRRTSDQGNLATFHISNFAFGGRQLRFGMELNF